MDLDIIIFVMLSVEMRDFALYYRYIEISHENRDCQYL